MARPLCAGLQVFVFVFVEFETDRTDTGRERRKKSDWRMKSMTVRLEGLLACLGQITPLQKFAAVVTCYSRCQFSPPHGGRPRSHCHLYHLLPLKKTSAGGLLGLIAMTTTTHPVSTPPQALPKVSNIARVKKRQQNLFPHLMQMVAEAKYHSGLTKVGEQKNILQRPTKRQRAVVYRRCASAPFTRPSCLTPFSSTELDAMGGCRTAATENCARILYPHHLYCRRRCPPRKRALDTPFVTPFRRRGWEAPCSTDVR